MSGNRYDILVREIVQFIKYSGVEDTSQVLNDLKFDVLELLYESETELKVLKRGLKIEPFSKEKLAENLSISSDYISDDEVGDILSTEEIIEIVDGIVDAIEKTGRKAISSDDIVCFTADYLRDNGYEVALEGYMRVNDRRKKYM